jgi:hypothetical protein
MDLKSCDPTKTATNGNVPDNLKLRAVHAALERCRMQGPGGQPELDTLLDDTIVSIMGSRAEHLFDVQTETGKKYERIETVSFHGNIIARNTKKNGAVMRTEVYVREHTLMCIVENLKVFVHHVEPGVQ